VRFVEGQSLGFRVIMALLGASMAALALFFMGWFALVEESALLAVAGFPFLLIGGSLAWVFRPVPGRWTMTRKADRAVFAGCASS
jgi:hypothetical protein